MFSGSRLKRENIWPKRRKIAPSQNEKTQEVAAAATGSGAKPAAREEAECPQPQQMSFSSLQAQQQFNSAKEFLSHSAAFLQISKNHSSHANNAIDVLKLSTEYNNSTTNYGQRECEPQKKRTVPRSNDRISSSRRRVGNSSQAVVEDERRRLGNHQNLRKQSKSCQTRIRRRSRSKRRRRKDSIPPKQNEEEEEEDEEVDLISICNTNQLPKYYCPRLLAQKSNKRQQLWFTTLAIGLIFAILLLQVTDLHSTLAKRGSSRARLDLSRVSGGEDDKDTSRDEAALRIARQTMAGGGSWHLLPGQGPAALVAAAGQPSPSVEYVAQQPQPQHPQDPPQPAPYKTFYVTQACEWKSNLFVPKSNDIFFAQSPAPDQQQQQQPPTPHQQQSRQPQAANYEGQRTYSEPAPAKWQPAASEQANVIMSTSNKALVLTLWPATSPPPPSSASSNSRLAAAAPTQAQRQAFNGYELACSIRLIVPRNMRILAKLSARKLTFTEEHQQQFLASSGELDARPEFAPTHWLNVSQNEFSETEQRTLETEGNVLAFRFLLERFASRQVPEMRFQVVLTAFQTLGENSDSSLQQQYSPTAGQSALPSTTTSNFESNQNAQFICDSQRLISANLACDGYKNCQDGHDEEPATCLALRGGHSAATGNSIQQQPANQVDTQQTNNNNKRKAATSSTATSAATSEESSFLWRAAKSLLALLGFQVDGVSPRGGHSNGSGSGSGQEPSSGGASRPLATFFLGFLMVLILLTCCSCCLYCCLILLRRWCSRRNPFQSLLDFSNRRVESPHHEESVASRRKRLRAAGIGSPVDLRAEPGGSSGRLLAERQNQDNAARLRLLRADQPQAQPHQLQSILKKHLVGGAPLAHFETLKAGPQDEQKPRGQDLGPAPPPRRGALASSLTSATGRQRRARRAAGQPDQQNQQDQLQAGLRPTPAKRRSRQLNETEVPPPLLGRASPAEEAAPVASGLPEAPPQGSSFSTRATRIEQSSSILSRRVEQATGQAREQRVTSYVYLEDSAKYSESYLMSRGGGGGPKAGSSSGQVQTSTPSGETADYVNLGGDQQQQQTTTTTTTGRQSSLI